MLALMIAFSSLPLLPPSLIRKKALENASKRGRRRGANGPVPLPSAAAKSTTNPGDASSKRPSQPVEKDLPVRIMVFRERERERERE